MKMIRHCTGGTIALTTSAATSPEIDISGASMGAVIVPAASTITSLTYYVALNTGGAYVAAQDSAGAAIVQTVAADEAHPIPVGVFGASTMRVVADNAGSVGVCLKS